MHGPRPGSTESGVGLIELMVTLTVTAMVLAAIYGAFFRTQRAAQVVMAEVDARQQVRGAVQLLERDIRMAGSGWGRLRVEGAYGGDTLVLTGVNPGYGGLGGSDSLSVLSGSDVSTTLRDAMAASTDAIRCVSTSGFGVGDLVVVTNGSTAHLFQITQVQASPADLLHDTSSPFNAAGGHANWPPAGYLTAARVFKVAWVSYRTDSTLFGRPSLLRYQTGKPLQLVAHDVNSFQVWYRLADETVTRNPQNLDLLTEVVPVVHPNGPQGSTASADSAWAAIRPRTF